jgi:hypothetical protein
LTKFDFGLYPSAMTHEKPFPCAQANLQVTFQWHWKIPDETTGHQKMGKHTCTGCGKPSCPVLRKNELPNFALCDFYRSLLGKT